MVLKTIDGGNNWSQNQLSGSPELTAVYFINENIGYIAGEGVIFSTIDGGNTWQDENISVNTELSDIHFLTPTMALQLGTPGQCWNSMY